MRTFLSALMIAGAAVAAHAAVTGFGLPMTRQSPLPLPTPAEACAALTAKTSGPGGGVFKRLDELPPGVVEHAVLRSVNGCPVREIRFQGKTYYVGPSIPKGVAPAVDVK